MSFVILVHFSYSVDPSIIMMMMMMLMMLMMMMMMMLLMLLLLAVMTPVVKSTSSEVFWEATASMNLREVVSYSLLCLYSTIYIFVYIVRFLSHVRIPSCAECDVAITCPSDRLTVSLSKAGNISKRLSVSAIFFQIWFFRRILT